MSKAFFANERPLVVLLDMLFVNQSGMDGCTPRGVVPNAPDRTFALYCFRIQQLVPTS